MLVTVAPGYALRLAEANLTLMALPFNTQAKLGQMRVRYGLSNQIHEHDLPFIDRPDVLTQFFGQFSFDSLFLGIGLGKIRVPFIQFLKKTVFIHFVLFSH